MYKNWGTFDFDKLISEDILVPSRDDKNKLIPTSVNKQYSDRLQIGQLNTNNQLEGIGRRIQIGAQGVVMEG